MLFVVPAVFTLLLPVFYFLLSKTRASSLKPRTIVYIVLFYNAAYLAGIVYLYWVMVHVRRNALQGATTLVMVFDFILLSAFVTAVYYRSLGLQMDGRLERNPGYSDCVYFSIITFTTVGYGDISPSGPSRPVAAAQAITGYLSMAILVATAFKILE